MRQRFLAAMCGYLMLGLLAIFTLDGLLRTAVLILLCGLAVKTWIAHKAGW